LLTLVRKDLVRPERTTLPADEAFRFRHLLIRDAAYEALPKGARAALHERFAAWLEAHAESLVELDEIVGYHLEQAYRYRAELGPLDEPARALAPRAAGRLIAAGRRAQERGDVSAAARLLGRGVDLLPVGSDARQETALALAVTLSESGELDRGASLLDEVATVARANGDEGLATRAALARIELSVETDPTALMTEALADCEAAAATLERLGDDAGVASALRLAGQLHGWLGRGAVAEELWLRALEHAERAARPLVVTDILAWLCWSTWWGPLPTDEGTRRLEGILARRELSRKVEAAAVTLRGSVKAMRGAFDEGRADVSAGRAMFVELGQRMNWAGTGMVAADVELLAARPDRAEELLRESRETFRGAAAESGYVATIVGMLSEAAFQQDRHDEALALADETTGMASPDDYEPRVRSLAVRARVLVRRGDVEAARRLAREALGLTEPTDSLTTRALAHLALADVEHVAREPESERAALAEALRLSEQKGDLVTAGRTRERLDALALAAGGST
jgi:tetratricopeptide (TPR) repeat protein